MNLYLSILILFFSPGLIKAAKECVYNQPFITYGDNFKDPQSDHMFTIGIVSRGDCSKDPTLSLESEETIKPSYKNPYSKKYGDPQVEYSRVAYFWYIKKTQLVNNKKWKITIDQETSKTEAELGFFDFPTRYSKSGESLKIGILADMDITERGLPTLNEITSLDQNKYDLLIHNGDMAYDIFDDQGMNGDYFFNNFSKITTKIPYSPLAGNHEDMDKGAFLNYRFRLPGFKEGDNYSGKYFSYDLKNTHFIFLDFDYLFISMTDKMDVAFNWLYQDLKKARENPQTKWIIFLTHRPFYCVDIKYSKDCKANFISFRKFEVLLIKFKVDLVILAHLHSYMRHKMMNNWKFEDYPSDSRTKYPIHVVVGHSGSKHFFNSPKDDERFYTVPFVEKVQNEHASWLELDINNERISATLKNSNLGTAADNFIVRKFKEETENPKSLIFLLSVIALTGVLIGLYFVVVRNKNTDDDVVRDSDGKELDGPDNYLTVNKDDIDSIRKEDSDDKA